MFKLQKNGYAEIERLLEYHRERDKVFIDAFFNHYYNNQWYARDPLDDETVMEILHDENGRVIGVIGNEYGRDGRLVYTGGYKNKKYDGEGKLYTELQDYEEGVFSNGKKNGVFVLHSERGIKRKATYVDNLENGEVIEYQNDSVRIRSRCHYIGGRRYGTFYEYAGDGSLFLVERYDNNIHVGDSYEYISSCICKNSGNNEYYYHFNPDCDFEYRNPKYNENYYNTQPIELLHHFEGLHNGDDGYKLVFVAIGEIYENKKSCEFCMFEL